MLELRHIDETTLRIGYAGDTYNTAVYLHRVAAELGDAIEVGYLTGIGEDTNSAAMRAAWAAQGVVDHAVVVPGKHAGLYTIRVDEHGERHFDYWRADSAARSLFSGTDWVNRLDADVLYLSGITLQMTTPAGRAALFTRLGKLRRQGATVALDTNYRADCWASARDAAAAIDSVAAHADIVLATLDDEIALHGSMSPHQAADRIAALGPAELIVKAGPAGAWLRWSGGVPEHLPAPAARVVDTTAAGDSFAAGYLAARIAGHTPPDAAQLASTVAGVVIGQAGAITPAELPLTHDSPLRPASRPAVRTAEGNTRPRRVTRSGYGSAKPSITSSPRRPANDCPPESTPSLPTPPPERNNLP
jgi:2-dehydro-3-deoxygluconokinase